MGEYGCKVCRVLDQHGLADRESELLDRWLADGPRRMGYRRLARWLNVAMLRRAMDRAGLSILGEEPASKYDRLTGGDEAVAEEVRSDLAASGVAIEDLETEFVSYGVVRTHLRECLGAERDRDPSEWEADSIRIATDHAERKVSEAVRSLVNKGKLEAGGDITVNVSVELECEACHVRVPADRALRRGHVCSESGESSPNPEESDANHGLTGRGSGGGERAHADGDGYSEGGQNS
jgi:hypothetical protein